MKKIFLISLFLLSANAAIYAQSEKVEVLYFKANLSCCKATACNALEGDIQTYVTGNFKNKNVVFKQIKIDDEANKDFIAQYKAQSQTVVLVKYKKGKVVKTEDISQQVKQYQFDKKKEVFEGILKTKINELL